MDCGPRPPRLRQQHGEKLLCPSAADDAPLVQYQDLVAELFNVFCVMAGHQQRRATMCHRAEQLPDVEAAIGV